MAMCSFLRETKQECIPVGCVPSAAVTVVSQHALGRGKMGVYTSMHWEGVCISACTGQGVSARGVSAGVVCPGGHLPGGVCPGGCLPHTPLPPVNRMTDACET